MTLEEIQKGFKPTEEGQALLDALTFDEEKHVYTYQGKKLISVTQLLARQGLSPNYAGVKKETLQKGADRGTVIHKEIEEYNKDGTIGFTEEFQFYKDFVENLNVIPVLSECFVTDGKIAGKFDQVLAVPNKVLTENGQLADNNDPEGYTLVIVDNKTTSSIHWDSISWQNTVYIYLFEKIYGIKIRRAAVMWLPKSKYGKCQFRFVELKSTEELNKVFEAENNDIVYHQEYPVDTDILAELEGLKLEKAKIDDRIKELSERVIKTMEEKAVFSFDTGYAKFTRVVSEGKETFDFKKYQADHQDVDFSSYMKKSKGSTSLKITMKGNEK